MDARRIPLLRLLPTPPVVFSEGTSQVHERGVDDIDPLALDRMTRSSVSDGWGTGQGSYDSEFTLPEREVPRLVPAVTSPAAKSLGHSLPRIPMRSTRRLDLLVPIADNDGHPFNPEDLSSFEGHLIALAGGFTRRGRISGVWQSPSGQVFTDESLAYSVTVPSDVAESVSADISRFIQTRFHQEAAWVEATPTFVAAL